MCKLCEEALNLLTERFGEDHAQFLLWNATCFPMSGETTLAQAKELVALPSVEEAYARAEPKEE